MFNSTHTLVGFALARTGLDGWNRRAAWTAVIASNLPDIDIAAGLYDMPAYIQYHRGITHSVSGILVLSVAFAGVMTVFSGNFRRTLIVALLAMATHPMLDYMNTYGVRPFLPFDDRWFYGDVLFVIDLYFDLILLAALIAGNVFSKRREALAIGGLAVVVLYVGILAQFRNLSRSYIAGHEKAAVSPVPFSPLVWTGLIENPGDVTVFQIDPLHGIVGDADRFLKDEPSPIIAKAAATRSGSAFFGFARFPVVRVRQIEAGYRVTFLDMRFFRGSSSGFSANVVLDPSLRVVVESLGFVNQRVD